MSECLPKDPVMLLSVLNTKLRDVYPSFQVLCDEMQADGEEITKKLKQIDYEYDAASNQFI